MQKDMVGLDDIKQFVSTNPVGTAIGAGVAVGGVAVGTVAIARAVKKRRSTKRKSSRKKRTSSGKKKRKPKYARTAGKGKDRSTKRIRMTKNGQPYIILRSGKARFIKKSSARQSRKRKGGRY